MPTYVRARAGALALHGSTRHLGEALVAVGLAVAAAHRLEHRGTDNGIPAIRLGLQRNLGCRRAGAGEGCRWALWLWGRERGRHSCVVCFR